MPWTVVSLAVWAWSGSPLTDALRDRYVFERELEGSFLTISHTRAIKSCDRRFDSVRTRPSLALGPQSLGGKLGRATDRGYRENAAKRERCRANS